jgi:hypothetical protein
MGIQLDWEVEAENSSQKSIGEDPTAKQKRRCGMFKLFFDLAILGGLFVGVVAFLLDQIDRVNEQMETALRDTIQAEIAALRIDDWQTYSIIQRSDSPEWRQIQRIQFEQYREILLNDENSQLTGQILDVEIDDPRARVHVQEIINGVPYTRVWFYWFYETETVDSDGRVLPAGWYHVPPDYTFWGNSQWYEGEFTTIAYRDVDLDFGQALGQKLDQWVKVACEAFICDHLPSIRVQVAPQDNQELGWAPGEITDDWVLVITSPYASRARTDMPFSPELQVEVAQLMAERLTSFQARAQRVISVDSQYAHQATINWLIGRFVQVDTQAYLIESLAQNYGTPAVGQLVRHIAPTDNISFLSIITNQPLDQSQLDWRDFFTWRLNQERLLSERSLLTEYLMLYDPTPNIQQEARLRFERKNHIQDLAVLSIGLTSPTDQGQTQVLATVATPEGETFQVLFRIVDNVWLRAN